MPLTTPDRPLSDFIAELEAAVRAGDHAGALYLAQTILRRLATEAADRDAEKVHVIAHSMGNRGLLRALQRISANAETRGRVKRQACVDLR